MPAGKPVGLHTRHNTKAEIAERKKAEAALHPDRGLPTTVPAILKKNKVASKTWNRLIREYDRIDADLISRLDIDLMIDYCFVMAQVEELDHMRANAHTLWHYLCEQRAKLADEGNYLEALALIDKIQKAYETILKIDARVDSKRKLTFTLRQSMFMTPRSRTGVAPKEDPNKRDPVDPFEVGLEAKLKLAREKVNGGSGDAE